MKRKPKLEADLDPPGHTRPGSKAADTAVANATGARKTRAGAVKKRAGRLEADLDPPGHTRPGSRAADVALANAGTAGKRRITAAKPKRKTGR